MANMKVAIQAASLVQDEATDILIVQAADLTALLAALRTTANADLGSKTASTSWDTDSDEFDLTNSAAITPQFAFVYCEEDTYITVNTVATDPGGTGQIVPGGWLAIIPCFGMTKLHYKSVTTGGTVNPTVYGA